jgi:hypothetical protein
MEGGAAYGLSVIKVRRARPIPAGGGVRIRLHRGAGAVISAP